MRFADRRKSTKQTRVGVGVITAARDHRRVRSGELPLGRGHRFRLDNQTNIPISGRLRPDPSKLGRAPDETSAFLSAARQARLKAVANPHAAATEKANA